MDFRNPKYNQFNTIDCEVNHPSYGWIPFTASPNDTELVGRDLYARIDKATVSPYVAPPPLPPTVPDVISDRQFFQALSMQNVITKEEALSAVKTGSVPSGMSSLIASLPAADQFAAEMLLSGATEFKRSHPLTASFGTAFGWTSKQIDTFWIYAASL